MTNPYIKNETQRGGKAMTAAERKQRDASTSQAVQLRRERLRRLAFERGGKVLTENEEHQ